MKPFSHFANSWIVGFGAFLTFSITQPLWAKESGYKFSFGAIADCQYCQAPDRGGRKYSASKEKLQKCVKHFNREDLSFVIHLGDFIDRNFSSFDDLLPIYNSLDAPGYHVLGNHDFEVADEYKSQVPEKLGMPSKYYDFKIKNWRFLCLDGNDLSFIAYPRGSKRYQDSETYYREKKIRSPKWNGGVGQKQMSWIREVLQTAEDSQEKVILFSHFPVYPPDPHNLWNAKEVISLLEEFSCVKAYINGHNHKGKYGIKNGIHYLTCKGMVDTNESAYSIANVFEDRIEIIGYGRETKEKFLKIRNNE
jgi:predicted MPP superfamily phosphohydrolase